jgi:LuxR family quorum-sensing system transcriptional regulator CciR
VAQWSDVQSFIDGSKRVCTAKELERLISDISLEMGFDFFALVHHVDLTPMNQQLTHMADGSLIAMTNYPPGWVEAYVARNIVANDPVHLASHRTNVGFRWDEVSRLIDVTSAHRAITADTRKAGLELGYTVPANVPGEANGSCSFAMRTGRALPEANLPMAQLVGSFAFQAARSLILQAKDMSAYTRRVALSERQLECIILVARGKSDWEISRILGISEETVKTHLKLAREAYDVPKRVQAVLRAIYDGQIALSDVFRR